MFYGAEIERYTEINKLLLTAFGQMSEISKSIELPADEAFEIKFVSFEDALKELIATKNL
jgi:hypothetical protein